MVYQCMICESIHFTGHAAELCCPTTKAIPDQNVVMCWRCRGHGWLNCACKGKGIWLAVIARHDIRMERRLMTIVAASEQNLMEHASG